MADRITHVVVQTTDTSEEALTALRFLKNVEHVAVVSDALLVIFEREMRDESEGYGLFERAIRRLDFVTDVTAYSGSWFEEPSGRGIILRIIKEVMTATSVIPQDVNDQNAIEQYVVNVKSQNNALDRLRSLLR